MANWSEICKSGKFYKWPESDAAMQFLKWSVIRLTGLYKTHGAHKNKVKHEHWTACEMCISFKSLVDKMHICTMHLECHWYAQINTKLMNCSRVMSCVYKIMCDFKLAFELLKCWSAHLANLLAILWFT